MTDFPEAAVAQAVRSTWQTSAATVYRNWLQYLMSRKADARGDPGYDPGRPWVIPETARKEWSAAMHELISCM